MTFGRDCPHVTKLRTCNYKGKILVTQQSTCAWSWAMTFWKHFPRYWPFVREFTGHRWISRTKASDAEVWCFIFFYLRLDKRLSKQSWGWWFETPSHSLWRRGRSCTSLRFRSYDDDNAMKYKQISIIFIMCLSNACCSMARGVTTCCYCIYRFHVKVYVYQMMIIKNAEERKNVLICHSKTTSVPTLFYRLPTLCSRIYKEKCMSYRELRFFGSRVRRFGNDFHE